MSDRSRTEQLVNHLAWMFSSAQYITAEEALRLRHAMIRLHMEAGARCETSPDAGHGFYYALIDLLEARLESLGVEYPDRYSVVEKQIREEPALLAQTMEVPV